MKISFAAARSRHDVRVKLVTITMAIVGQSGIFYCYAAVTQPFTSMKRPCEIDVWRGKGKVKTVATL